MASDLLEQLAEREVPPVPAELNRQVHQRLNRALLIAHVLDFVFEGVPSLLGHFVPAVGHLLGSTLSGRFEADHRDRPPRAP